MVVLGGLWLGCRSTLERQSLVCVATGADHVIGYEHLLARRDYLVTMILYA